LKTRLPWRRGSGFAKPKVTNRGLGEADVVGIYDLNARGGVGDMCGCVNGVSQANVREAMIDGTCIGEEEKGRGDEDEEYK
jgi:hypothetical protein